jgi:hypothetical protein
MDDDLKLGEINVNELSNDDLIKQFNALDAFLKVVNEEIKKTDVGDTDE